MRKIIIIILTLFLLTGTVFAQEGETQEFAAGVEDIISDSVAQNKATILQAAELAAILTTIVLLCKCAAFAKEKSSLAPASLIGSAAITAACAVSMQAMIRLGSETIEKIMDHALLMLPALASATVSTGAYGTAGAIYSGTILFSDLIMALITKILVPLVYVFIGVATANAALNNHLLDSLREFISWLISGSLKIILYVYIGYVTLSGIISGGTDAAAVKATKLAMGNAVPVVGSIISDASETVVAGAMLLKNSLGVAGMLGVLGICVSPFLKIAIHYLILKLTKAVCGTVGMENHVTLIGDLSTAMGFLLSMTGTCALIMLLSVICFMKAVGA